MGLNPPPAILVRPDDALASVRSAVLLGAVVPEMREQVEELTGDLKDMQKVTASIRQEQEKLKETRTVQAEEQKRQSLLLEEKKKLQSQSEQEIETQRKRSEELAAKAGSLKDLIDGLDKQMAGVRDAAEAARKAEADRLAAARKRPGNRRRTTRICEPRSILLRCRASLPACGWQDHAPLRREGRRRRLHDGAGGRNLAFCHDYVTFRWRDTLCGHFPFLRAALDTRRGQWISCRHGWHGSIDVSQGQFVLAGEPVGAMGEKLLASVAPIEVGNGAPLLYIEFRKDGKPVDPAPWWTERLSGRT